MAEQEIQIALLAQMQSRYGLRPEQVRFVRAPYRICPLGAHVDHQLGTVTAMTIDRGVSLAYAPLDSAEVRLASLSYPGEVRFSLQRVPPRANGDWGNYARGAALALRKVGKLARGLIGITSGDLAEMGLSSSASIGVAYLLALEQVNGLAVTAADNIRLDQAVENEYLGLRNGILDQSAILLARRDHLTVIDCKAFAEAAPGDGGANLPPGISLIARPAALPRFGILVAFSGLTKPLQSTDYNRRVAECADAARLLLEAAGRPHAPARLGEVSDAEYEAHRARLPGVLAKRAEHFFSEMRRVRRGIQAWKEGDLAGFGQLVSDSGRSSIQHYECGAPPLIDLYEILVGTPGVYGARFSGAGFRGCCIALADPAAAERALCEIERAYVARRPELAAQARFFLCQTDDGARLQ